ncbi:stage III sporulation protein AF [Paenibacillus ginsengarvi]|uniref:Stage III sporulation protein AF n=1 Tax=Paenibacillus ginsengarvi TaxID=400777 RepID=A0A3B0CGP5_9BACL|nr:stage III sporulation protein AF [Paenibacillus ginsengarvi]RKN84703.1 stage III sporulation protein AF [Paenibacillus ginsengarvi]
MVWLSGWLKEIIVIVLLAAFVELLLPNNAYQRYVRTVLGLFILLSLLSPLLSVFKMKWDSQKILASVERLGDVGTGGQTFGQMRSMQAIMQDADRWRQSDRSDAQRLMEKELAAELQSSIGGEANVTVKQVKLQISYDNNGTPSMKHMQVILDHRQSPEGTATAEPPGRKPIAAVEPVTIDIRVGRSEAKSDETKLTSEQIAAKGRIYDQLKRQWQLNRDQVTLLYESELEKER